MKIMDPGHEYELKCLDNESVDGFVVAELKFVKRMGPSYPGNESAYYGTISQEVMRALINRAQYVNNQIPHHSNLMVIDSLRDCIWALEQRAADRHGRELPSRETVRLDVENIPTCNKCSHIFCEHMFIEHAK